MPFESTSNWTSTLGTPRGAGGMPSMQLEVAELLVVLGHRALPLEDLDLYAVIHALSTYHGQHNHA